MIKELILIVFLVVLSVLYYLLQSERNKETNISSANETSEKLNKLILALKEYSENHADLASVLKKLGIF